MNFDEMQRKIDDIKHRRTMRRLDEIKIRHSQRKNILSSLYKSDNVISNSNNDADELDPDGWVTINGAAVNIGENGEILAGMGGKYTGQKIGEIGSSSNQQGRASDSRIKFD